jgi:hypothetical protein
VVKIPGSEKIEHEEDQRDDTIINAIPEERLCCGCKKSKMTAKQNKRGHMPAHDKHSYGNTNKCEADCSHISQVFRRKKKRIRAIIFHKSSINCTKQHKPEYEQNLVPPEMEEQ